MPTQTLHFNQPKLTSASYQITDNDKQVGTLVYHDLLHNKAAASFNNTTWQFTKQGLFGTKVTIVSEGKQGMVFQKGSITLDGTTFAFRRGGLGLSANFAWKNESGDTIIKYAVDGLFKKSGDITLEESAPPAPELLVVLGLFLALKKDSEDSTAAAGSTAAV